jgi:hypothetical protein
MQSTVIAGTSAEVNVQVIDFRAGQKFWRGTRLVVYIDMMKMFWSATN